MAFKHEPHKPERRKGLPWPVCNKCGLVYLKNDFTRWCIARGCNAEDHPGYKAALRRFTGEEGR